MEQTGQYSLTEKQNNFKPSSYDSTCKFSWASLSGLSIYGVHGMFNTIGVIGQIVVLL